jgi:hypothetical protein
MRGSPIWPTKRRKPESRHAFGVRHLKISAIAGLLVKAFPKCVFMSEVGIGCTTPHRFGGLCLANWRRKASQTTDIRKAKTKARQLKGTKR